MISGWEFHFTCDLHVQTGAGLYGDSGGDVSIAVENRPGDIQEDLATSTTRGGALPATAPPAATDGLAISGHRAQDADTGSSGPHTATGALMAGAGS